MVKFLAVSAFMVFSALSSDAHRHKFTGTYLNDSTVDIEQKIGDVDYQKYGNLNIEKSGSKLYLTFPLLIYATRVDFHSHANDTILIGSPIFLTLSDGENITSKTDKNTDFTFHYLWPEDFNPHFGNFVWHDDKNAPKLANGTYYIYYYYATTWFVKFEFKPSDMLALSTHRIVGAHAKKGSQIIFIPIKKKQSKRIEQAISALLRN